MLNNATTLSCALATVAGLTSLASADLLVNGGFEDNLNSDTMYNMANIDFNQSMAGVTAFGEADEVDIIHRENSNFGLPAIEGDWSIALHSSAFTGLDDGIAMAINSNTLRGAGHVFRVEFSAQLATEFDLGPGRIEIGVSSTDDTFGQLVHSFDMLEQDQWLNLDAEFATESEFSFLTIRTARNAAPGAWFHLDDVSLQAVPTPGVLPLLASTLLILPSRRRRVGE